MLQHLTGDGGVGATTQQTQSRLQDSSTIDSSTALPTLAYAAAHLRLGGQGHEGLLKRGRGTGRGELADVITALGCARQLLAASHSSSCQDSSGTLTSSQQVTGVDAQSSNPLPQVLLVTDNHVLRSFVLAGGLVSLSECCCAAAGWCASLQWAAELWQLQSVSDTLLMPRPTC